MSALGTAESAGLAHARELALRGRGRVSPNPLVGAVILRDGRLIAEGWHDGPGTAHAEAMALAIAGDAARGATLICTLEPCSHFGRTSPCSDAVIAAGVARVVIGCCDPLERTRRQGLEKLRQAGIEVVVASDEDEYLSRELISAFVTHAVRGRPHVMLKLATSLDGKVATATGESQWISGHESRAHVHRLRADHDAVIAGINTVLADDPQLNARNVDGPVRQPTRVIFDAHARLPVTSQLARSARETPVIVMAGSEASEARCQALAECGVEVVRHDTPQPDIAHALTELGAREMQSVFIEGGAHLAGAFVRAKAVDVVQWFLAPILIGGDGAPGALGGDGVGALADAARLTRVVTTRRGDDIVCVGRLIDLPETGV